VEPFARMEELSLDGVLLRLLRMQERADMAASTVQLPNECACGTATWGQEGFLVERMVDEGCSEFGWRAETGWTPTRH
jgi:hypothetical protein